MNSLRFRARSRPRTLAYQVPTLVTQGGSQSGGAVTTSGTLSGDFVIGCITTATTSIPDLTGMSGYTQFGAGISSDESGNDCGFMVVAKFFTGSNETIPAPTTGTSRTAYAVFRGVDPTILDSMPSTGTSTSNRFKYLATSGGSWVVPDVSMSRNAAVVCLGKRMGTTDTRFTDLTEIHVQNAASGQAQVFWTAAEVSSFTGYSYGMGNSQARAACSVPLYGAEA